MATDKKESEVKICRLRDIVLHHLRSHEGTEVKGTTLGQIDNLEDDLKRWFRNIILGLEELNMKPETDYIGFNDNSKKVIGEGQYD